MIALAAGGISELGTVLAPYLPDSLTNNPMPSGKPWGKRNSTNTNQYKETPNTGVTRHYDFTISKTRCAPDGVEVDCILANDQYPGPTIEANWGDYIEVKVHNNLTDEGTSIHWHGILQTESQWEDGVPGFTQCPIAPDSGFTYRFRADLYGTSWWHAHYSAQYGSGLVGPMIIYGPKNVEDDIDLGPVMLQDWYHTYYQEEIHGLFQPIPDAVVPRADSNTINGKGSYPCSKTSKKCDDDVPMATFNFTSGKEHRLRLINPSSAATQKFTIDGHKFKVVATDFVEIQPYETDVITLAVGQRSDVIVSGTGEPTDAVYMRAFRPTSCSLSHGNEEVLATVYYEDADRKKMPKSSPGPNAYNGYCGNDPLEDQVPIYAIEASEPSVTEITPVELKSNGTHVVWYMGGRTFRGDDNDPMLLDINNGNLDFDPVRNVHNYGSNKTLRFVIENTGPQPHPMHLHGSYLDVNAFSIREYSDSCTC
jgi:FtsP/CotA-like multicopper oxidase with cupredoxin domain